jgi:hypothetical protein
MIETVSSKIYISRGIIVILDDKNIPDSHPRPPHCQTAFWLGASPREYLARLFLSSLYSRTDLIQCTRGDECNGGRHSRSVCLQCFMFCDENFKIANTAMTNLADLKK